MYPFINILNREIPLYGLMMVIGILVAGFIASLRLKGSKTNVDDLILLITLTIASALLGAKLLYIFITYGFADIKSFILSGNFQFFINSGFVFYGGLISGILGIIICHKIFGIDFFEYEYSIVPVIPIGHAFGRIGCFLAGCCHGDIYCGFGKVFYPANNISGLNPALSYFPTQLVEAFFNFVIFLILVYYANRNPKILNITALYALLYSILRFFIEFTRGDEIRGAFLGLYTSQWISIFLAICAIFVIFILNKDENEYQ